MEEVTKKQKSTKNQFPITGAKKGLLLQGLKIFILRRRN
jgi:hypothetical protein